VLRCHLKGKSDPDKKLSKPFTTEMQLSRGNTVLPAFECAGNVALAVRIDVVEGPPIRTRSAFVRDFDDCPDRQNRPIVTKSM
jgi:hypothetical protein